MFLKRILEAPIGYLFFQYLIGGIQTRRLCIQQHVPLRPGMRVLDIGCGPGYVAGWLEGISYVGLDADPGYIKYASRKYADRGAFSCELLTDEYAARQEPFDFVIMMGVLHHLDDAQMEDILRLIRQVLKPNGRLITLDGYRHDQISAAAKFFLDNDRGRFIRTKDGYLNLCKKWFPQVKTFDKPEYFNIPYATLVIECSSSSIDS